MKTVASHWIRIPKHILGRVRHRVSFSVSDLSVFPPPSFGSVFPIFGYVCVCVLRLSARACMTTVTTEQLFLPVFQFTCQLSFHPRYAINYQGWNNRLHHEHSLIPILHLKHTASFLDEMHFLRMVSNVNAL